MTRLLLTLLALLTGLVAQTAPASARIVVAGGAEVTIQLPGHSKRAAIVSRVASKPTATAKWNTQPSATFTPVRVAPVATVLIGIDRASE